MKENISSEFAHAHTVCTKQPCWVWESSWADTDTYPWSQVCTAHSSSPKLTSVCMRCVNTRCTLFLKQENMYHHKICYLSGKGSQWYKVLVLSCRSRSWCSNVHDWNCWRKGTSVMLYTNIKGNIIFKRLTWLLIIQVFS